MKALLHRLNAIASARFGIRAMRTDRLYPWQTAPGLAGTRGSSSLPEGAADWLRPDNPLLAELLARYAVFDPRVTTPARWTADRLRPEDLLWFRGDNAFLWQVRGAHRDPLSYALCYYQFAASDDEGLLDRLDEDDLFGIHLVELDGRPVSRDLIDSAREIQFLRRHLALGDRQATILDIGAGYGGAAVLPLDEVEPLLAREPVDLAVNVHSFSECTVEAIAWWVERLAAARVRHFLIVPNPGTKNGRECQAADGTNIEPLLARCGYQPKAREPRYSDPFVQAYGLDPVWLHLFELA